MSAPTRKDYLGWAATVFALVVTFSAEYELAKAVGIHHWVALAVPGALDVYVLRALQVRRDVFLTVLAMILVNAASHLVTAGVLRVEWPLIVAVSAIAPLVLWRSHVLGGFTGTEEWRVWRKAKILDVPENVVRGHENVPEHASVVPGFEEHADQAQEVANLGTVNVPRYDDWLDKDVPVLGYTFPGSPVLTLVANPEPGTLLPEDEEHTENALKVMENTGAVPSIRVLKAELSVGADKARRLQHWLRSQEEVPV